jgi:hypothetical protein
LELPRKAGSEIDSSRSLAPKFQARFPLLSLPLLTVLFFFSAMAAAAAVMETFSMYTSLLVSILIFAFIVVIIVSRIQVEDISAHHSFAYLPPPIPTVYAQTRSVCIGLDCHVQRASTWHLGSVCESSEGPYPINQKPPPRFPT